MQLKTETFQELLDIMSSSTQSMPWTLIVGNGFSIQYDSRFRCGYEPESDTSLSEFKERILSSPIYTKLQNLLIAFDGENATISIPSITRSPLSSSWETMEYEEILDTIQHELKDEDRKEVLQYMSMLYQETIHGTELNVSDSGQCMHLIRTSFLYEPILSIHPSSHEDITSSQAENCIGFLSPFLKGKGIFTLNYDLLPAWAMLRYEKDHSTTDLSIRDGIPTVASQPFDITDANIFYLHGAFHLHAICDDCYKTDEMFFDKASCLQAIRQGQYPLLVSNYSHVRKMNDINSNRYLKACYERLEGIHGNIVFFGVSLRENDQHILQALQKSKEDGNTLTIHFGLYADESALEAKANAISALLNSFDLQDAVYFQTKGISIW